MVFKSSKQCVAACKHLANSDINKMDTKQINKAGGSYKMHQLLPEL